MSVTGIAFDCPALHPVNDEKKKLPWRAGAALGCLILVIYLTFFGGHWVMQDQNYRLAWAEVILDHGSNDISAPDISTKYGIHAKYSKYGVGQSLIHIPFILMARGIHGLTGMHCEGPLSMIVYVLNGGLGIVLVFLILCSQGITPRSAFYRALIIGVASVWFPYTKVEYGESLVTTLVLATWLLGPRIPLLAGLLAGFAVSIRMDALLWAIPTILLTTASRQNKFKSLLAMLPGIILTGWTNYARTGSIVSSGYEPGFIHNPIFGLYGELFSFGKSIFLFSPLLVLYPLVIVPMFQNERSRRLALWSGVLLAGQLLFFARWWDWSGDDAWGPRFVVLSTICSLILIAASPLADKKLWWTLAALGLGAAIASSSDGASYQYDAESFSAAKKTRCVAGFHIGHHHGRCEV